MFDKAENILNDDVMSYLIDNVSHSLINELDTSELIKKRRKNFIFLSNTLKEVEGIKPVFKKIPDAICPLFFPVYIEKGRKKFKDFLISKSIYCPIHWSIPRQINISNYLLSKKIYNSILSIPCDQRYDVEDMRRIVDVINIYKETE